MTKAKAVSKKVKMDKQDSKQIENSSSKGLKLKALWASNPQLIKKVFLALVIVVFGLLVSFAVKRHNNSVIVINTNLNRHNTAAQTDQSPSGIGQSQPQHKTSQTSSINQTSFNPQQTAASTPSGQLNTNPSDASAQASAPAGSLVHSSLTPALPQTQRHLTAARGLGRQSPQYDSNGRRTSQSSV